MITEHIKINEFDCYITDQSINKCWLAYIDVTSYPDIQSKNFGFYDKVLPFHGGCTFCGLVSGIGNIKFNDNRFLIGCDWSHNYNFSGISLNTLGREDVSLDVVKSNLVSVVNLIPKLIIIAKMSSYR